MNFIKLYLIALPIFSVIDLIWITVFAKNFYQEQIGHLMASEVRLGPAVLFYLLFLFGLIFFAVMPAIRENNWAQALISGALFGLICYATYDLTNLATLARWPLKMVYCDMIWGAVLSGSVSLATYSIGKFWID